jgi:release factor glutamine methyltransferase
MVRVVLADGVYGPAEDTMLMLEAIEVNRGERVLEVGTGSGFLAIHCALAGAVVVAMDVNPMAATSARAGGRASGTDFEVIVSDLASGVRGPYSLVVFNPPYLPGRMGQFAVDGGAGGVEVAGRLLKDLPRLLGEGGRLLLLLSSHSDAGALSKRFLDYEFKTVKHKRLFFEELAVYEVRLTKK